MQKEISRAPVGHTLVHDIRSIISESGAPFRTLGSFAFPERRSHVQIRAGWVAWNKWLDGPNFILSDIIIPTKPTWAQIYAWDGVTTKKAFVATQISMSLRPNL